MARLLAERTDTGDDAMEWIELLAKIKVYEQIAGLICGVPLAVIALILTFIDNK